MRRVRSFTRLFVASGTLLLVAVPAQGAAYADETGSSDPEFSGQVRDVGIELLGRMGEHWGESSSSNRVDDGVVTAPIPEERERRVGRGSARVPVDPRQAHISSNPCITSETEADFDCVRMLNDTCGDPTEVPESLQAAGGSTMVSGIFACSTPDAEPVAAAEPDDAEAVDPAVLIHSEVIEEFARLSIDVGDVRHDADGLGFGYRNHPSTSTSTAPSKPSPGRCSAQMSPSAPFPHNSASTTETAHHPEPCPPQAWTGSTTPNAPGSPPTNTSKPHQSHLPRNRRVRRQRHHHLHRRIPDQQRTLDTHPRNHHRTSRPQPIRHLAHLLRRRLRRLRTQRPMGMRRSIQRQPAPHLHHQRMVRRNRPLLNLSPRKRRQNIQHVTIIDDARLTPRPRAIHQKARPSTHPLQRRRTLLRTRSRNQTRKLIHKQTQRHRRPRQRNPQLLSARRIRSTSEEPHPHRQTTRQHSIRMSKRLRRHHQLLTAAPDSTASAADRTHRTLRPRKALPLKTSLRRPMRRRLRPHRISPPLSNIRITHPLITQQMQQVILLSREQAAHHTALSRHTSARARRTERLRHTRNHAHTAQQSARALIKHIKALRRSTARSSSVGARSKRSPSSSRVSAAETVPSRFQF